MTLCGGGGFFHLSIITSFFSPAKRRRHRQESKELLAKPRSALYRLSEQKQIFSSQVTFVHELQYSGEVILWAIFTLWLDACSEFNPPSIGEKQRTPSSLWDNSQQEGAKLWISNCRRSPKVIQSLQHEFYSFSAVYVKHFLIVRRRTTEQNIDDIGDSWSLCLI